MSKDKTLHQYHQDLIKEIDDAAWLDKIPTVDDIEEQQDYLKSLTNGGKTYSK
jgi:hypothetical protein